MQENSRPPQRIILALSLLFSLSLLAGCAYNRLAVNTAGTGTGTVTSAPPGIYCSGRCDTTVTDPTTTFSLTPNPGAGSVFAGWGGDCSGSGPCSVTMSGHRTVFAFFRRTTVAAGAYHTCALVGPSSPLSDGTVWCWGRANDGQLGNGRTQPSSQPTPAQAVGISTAVAIAAGGFHTCALLADGTVWCWGHNADGELGDGSNFDASAPQQVVGISTAVAIAAGGYHSCVILSNGTVQCWGHNADGQLGDKSNQDSNRPVPVEGIATAIAIAAGAYHTCALLSLGVVDCWGHNAAGQLGNRSNQNSNYPVRVMGISAATSIAAGMGAGLLGMAQLGGFHTCALLADGTVWCWGHNADGALGNGSNQDSNQPVRVASSSTAAAIAAGAYHTCAILSAGARGQIECWGHNADGELGNGSNQASNRPVPVAANFTATAIAAGGFHTCAALSTAPNQIRCWGHNADGELGNWSTISSNLPAIVWGF